MTFEPNAPRALRARSSLAIALLLPAIGLAWMSSCGQSDHPPHAGSDEPYDAVSTSDSSDLRDGDLRDVRDGADLGDAQEAGDGASDARSDGEVSADADAMADGADAIDAFDAPDALDARDSIAADAIDADAIDGIAIDGDTGPATIVDECGPPLSTATGAACGATVQLWSDEGHAHVDVGTHVLYCTHPPSSGPHYPSWAAFRSYDHAINSSFLVHDLEHGAVVVRYQCATSCPAVAAQLQAIIDARPIDPMCDADAGVKRRVILVPDPALDIAVAASAWTWTYRATCVDSPSLGAFIDAHYAMAAENFCFDGDPDAGPP